MRHHSERITPTIHYFHSNVLTGYGNRLSRSQCTALLTFPPLPGAGYCYCSRQTQGLGRGVVRGGREVTFPSAFHEGWKQVLARRPQNPPHLGPEQRQRPRGVKVGWHSCSCRWAWRGPGPLLSSGVWADLCRHGGGVAWNTQRLCFTYTSQQSPSLLLPTWRARSRLGSATRRFMNFLYVFKK